MFTDEPPGNEIWQRPLDWRYIKYSNDLPINVVNGIKSVTALCSDPILSPPNACKLKEIIKSHILLYFLNTTTKNLSHSKTLQGIAEIKSSKEIENANNLIKFDIHFAVTKSLFGDLQVKIEEYLINLENKFIIDIITKNDINVIFSKIKKDYLNNKKSVTKPKEIIAFKIKSQYDASIKIIFSLQVDKKLFEKPKFKPIFETKVDKSMFYFNLNIYAPFSSKKSIFQKKLSVHFDNYFIVEYNKNDKENSNAGKADSNKICNIIDNWIKKKQVWSKAIKSLI